MGPAEDAASHRQQVHAEIVKGLQHDDLRNYLQRADNPAVGRAPAEYRQFLGQEIDEYVKLVKLSGAKADP